MLIFVVNYDNRRRERLEARDATCLELQVHQHYHDTPTLARSTGWLETRKRSAKKARRRGKGK